MKRLLVTGASGALGSAITHIAARAGQQVWGTYFSNAQIGGGEALRLDLADARLTRDAVLSLRPEVILHTAVSDRSAAFEQAIPLAAHNLSTAACEVGARLIALSTDMVFDGSRSPYVKDAEPSPLTAYGKAKAAMEQIIRAACPTALIVRTSLLYDFTPANTQVAWMLARIQAGQKITLFTDEIRQPMWLWDAAERLLRLASLDVSGILHTAGPQALSRWDFGVLLLKAIGIDPGDVAEPVLRAQFGPGPRPGDLTLDQGRADALLGPALTVSEALAQHRQRDQGQAASITTRR